MKKLIALLLALALVLSLAACTPDPEGELEGDLNNGGQIEMGQDDVDEIMGLAWNPVLNN